MLLQFMAVYQLLLSMLYCVDFFMDGSRLINWQVRCCAAVSIAIVDRDDKHCSAGSAPHPALCYPNFTEPILPVCLDRSSTQVQTPAM